MAFLKFLASLKIFESLHMRKFSRKFSLRIFLSDDH